MTANDDDALVVRDPRDIRRYRRRLDIYFERYKDLPLAKQQVAKAIVRGWRHGLNMKELAQHLGIKVDSVSSVSHRLGLPTREQWLQRKVEMFLLRGLNRHTVSARLGISLIKADRLRQKLGFPSTARWRSLPTAATDVIQLELFE